MKARADAADVLAKVRSYQLEIYKNGMFSNISPRVTTDTVRLEEEAEKHIEPRAFKYVAGGAGEGATQKSNRSAFGRWQVTMPYCAAYETAWLTFLAGSSNDG